MQFIIFNFSFQAIAQPDRTLDSLNAILRNLPADANNDTARARVMMNLVDEYIISNQDSVFPLCRRVISMIDKKIPEATEKERYDLLKIKGEALINIGAVYSDRGDFPKALIFFQNSLKIKEVSGDKRGIATALNNIGMIYDSQGDIPNALEYYHKSLKIKEEIHDKQGIANTLNNIGYIYDNQDDLSNALDYYEKGLIVYEEIGYKQGVATALNNIGFLYQNKSNMARQNGDSATWLKDNAHVLDYFNKALRISEETGDKIIAAALLSNIGNNYMFQDNFPMALEYYNKSRKIREEIRDKQGIADILYNIGSAYFKQKNYTNALAFSDSSLALAKVLGFTQNIRNSEDLQYRTYRELYIKSNRSKGDYAFSALEHYRQYIVYRDSIVNESSRKSGLKKQMQYEYEKKAAIAKTEHDKETAVATAEHKKQRLFLILIAAVAVAIGVIAVIIFRSLRITRKQKRLIELQKNEVSRQKEIVEQQKAVVEDQKKKVELHQKEIIDSITYAKRLQDAILPPFNLIKQHLPNTFILYKPKDIVAGDFYWMEAIPPSPQGEGVGGEVIFIAACDCTGHGVPGALVSVVCSNALNRAVKEFGLRDTGKILDKVTDLVLETFEKSSSDVKDGMDISLLRIDLQGFKNLEGLARIPAKIQWSGANNPLWYIQNKELIEIKADKQPIGKFDKRKPFTTHTIDLTGFQNLSGLHTTFYLFTDGFADQFGGPNGKKFRYRQFEEKLTANSHLPLIEQKEKLEKEFMEWQGELEQVDDVTVIGIRV